MVFTMHPVDHAMPHGINFMPLVIRIFKWL